MVLLIVQFSISCPGGRHAACRNVGSVFDQAEKLVFTDGLSKLAQDVVVHIPRVAASKEKCTGMIVASYNVLSR
jgi:hypothetical protein